MCGQPAQALLGHLPWCHRKAWAVGSLEAVLRGWAGHTLQPGQPMLWLSGLLLPVSFSLHEAVLLYILPLLGLDPMSWGAVVSLLDTSLYLDELPQPQAGVGWAGLRPPLPLWLPRELKEAARTCEPCEDMHVHSLKDLPLHQEVGQEHAAAQQGGPNTG